MKTRLLVLLVLSALLASPLLLTTRAQPIAYATTTIRVVEGHTVLATLAQVENSTPAPSTWSALRSDGVRAIGPPIDGGPGGTRWTNDQDLVEGGRGAALAILVEEASWGNTRYPCVGALLVTNEGALVPGEQPGLAPERLTYVESYLVTDPNEHSWSIDRWIYSSASGDVTLWSEPLEMNDAGSDAQDDGVSSCTPYLDDSVARATGDNGLHYPDGGPHALARFGYNAVFYLPVDALVVLDRPVTHAPDARAGVPSVCTYPCANTAAQGNSHSFDLWTKAGEKTQPDGGATLRQFGNATFGAWAHPTFDVDVGYGPMPTPLVRAYTIVDTEGSTSAFPK